VEPLFGERDSKHAYFLDLSAEDPGQRSLLRGPRIDNFPRGKQCPRTMHIRLGVWVGALGISAAGCDSAKLKEFVWKSEAPVATVAAPSQASALPAQTAPAGNPPGASALPELPPLARGALDLAPMKAARDLVDKAEASEKAGVLDQALTEYREAMHGDAGHLNARYGYARVLAKQGRIADVLSTLAPLKALGCPWCIERLMAAATDPEFASVQKDKGFVELTGGLGKELPKLSTAAKHMEKWFMSTPSAVQPEESLLDPRALIVVEDRSPKAPARYVQLLGNAEFRKFLQARFPNGVYPGKLTCTGSCCKQTSPLDLRLAHLTELCFKTIGAAAVHLYKIQIEGDPAQGFGDDGE